MTCRYPVVVIGSRDEGTRRNPEPPTYLCGKCWRRHCALDFMQTNDAMAIRRMRKRNWRTAARRGRR